MSWQRHPGGPEGNRPLTERFSQFGVHHSNQASNLGLPQESVPLAEYNRESFFKHDAGAVGRYMLDIAALQAAPTRIVLAGGQEGREYFPYRCAAALAQRLGTVVVEFPGSHAGFVDHPSEFAERLRQILGDEAAK
jgi:pimeloyl-ACP methyl ester carboxylesterase